MSNSAQVLKAPSLMAVQFTVLDYYFTVNSNAAVILPAGNNAARLVWGYSAATPLTTAAIDSFTGNTGDILGDTCFDATSLGTDAIGFVIDMQGQAQSAVALQAALFDSTVIWAGVAGTSTALTSSLSTALCCSPLGNLYGRAILTGFDAASTKHMWLRVVCKLK